jgi:hypothetical protein
VNVTGGAGVVAVFVFVAGAGVGAGVPRAGVVGFVSAEGSVGVVAVAALLAAAGLAFEADALAVGAVTVAGLGIGLNGVPGLKSENPLSWPGPSAATTTPVGEVVVAEPTAPGVVEVVVVPPGVKLLELPLIALRSFGPWSAATPRNATPRTIAMMRARLWRSWA